MGGCVGLGHRVDWFVDVEPVGGEEGPAAPMIFRGLPEQTYVFWEPTPFFRTTLPIFRTPGVIRLVPRRQPKAGGSPFNAVSTVPVGRQAMPR